MKVLVALGLAVFVTLSILSTAEGQVPQLPHLFYGDVEVASNPAAVGTTITAEVNGVERGSITVTQAGKYGGPNALDPKLKVQGDSIAVGEIVRFFVDGVEANQTFDFESGATTELDLSASAAPTPSPTPVVAPTLTPTPTPSDRSRRRSPTPSPIGVEQASTLVEQTILPNGQGIVQETRELISSDGFAHLVIPAGVTALTAESAPLTGVSVESTNEFPQPAEQNVVGLAYDFQPSGATFAPPLRLTLRYDSTSLPLGVNEEDLVIALYDLDLSQWVALTNIVLNPVTNTITGDVDHFTLFAVVSGALALTATPIPLPTEPATPVSTATVTPPLTATPSPTSVPPTSTPAIVPTATPSPTSVPPTPTPTIVPTATPSPTSVPPTSTLAIVQTATPSPTSTSAVPPLPESTEEEGGVPFFIWLLIGLGVTLTVAGGSWAYLRWGSRAQA